jgi:3-dehydrosphinganine reductase
MVARRLEAKKEAEKELRALPFVSPSQRISLHTADVSHNAAMHKAILECVAIHGKHIDAVVASAGLTGPKVFTKSTPDEFDALYKVNVIGIRNTVAACLPYMDSPSGGRIVLVSSQAGATGIYGYSAYSASKFALRGLFECLSQELYNTDIRASLCLPPDTDTPGLAFERESIPALTKILTASSDTVQPDVVARAILDGMVSWTPYIGVGIDGWFLNLATVGMGPAGSFGAGLVQVLLGSLVRLIALAYTQYFYWVIRNKEAEVMGKGKKDK